MLSRSSKAAFFLMTGPAMRVNAWIHRAFRAPTTGAVKAHLGPGQEKYIPGWVNVDANMFTARCDVWADLRYGIPFRTGTVSALYSHHVVEHLADLKAHFREAFRCLKPGGVYRVGGPNGDSAMTKYAQGDLEWFGTFPDAWSSIGGRLDNFLLCRNEHLRILTRSYLVELMGLAGFADISVRKPCIDTGFPELFHECLRFEHESDPIVPHTLIVEAIKPR